MKKAISLFAVIVLILSTFAGCQKTYDVDAAIQKLKGNDMIISESYETKEDVEGITTMLNAQIEEYDGGFTVELTRMVLLTQGEDISQICQIFVFSNERQAKKMENFYTSVREAENTLKVARSGNVLIFTNVTLAEQTLGLTFA